MPCSARVVFGEKPRRTARAKKIIAIHHVCANQPLVPLLQTVKWPLSRSSSCNNNVMWEKEKKKNSYAFLKARLLVVIFLIQNTRQSLFSYFLS